MVEKQEYASVVKTIIDMAHSMNMEVIAEGIETEYQLEFLRKHGCKYAQGYIFSLLQVSSTPSCEPCKMQASYRQPK